MRYPPSSFALVWRPRSLPALQRPNSDCWPARCRSFSRTTCTRSTPSQLTDDALKGMLSRLDPHSSYMTQAEFRESMEDMNGKFGGIGLKITDHDGVPIVLSPIDGTPAAQAGVQPGDEIVSVDGQSTHGADLMEVVRIIRGKPGTTVKLTIVRGEKSRFEVPLTRQIIKVHSVTSNWNQITSPTYGSASLERTRQTNSGTQSRS